MEAKRELLNYEPFGPEWKKEVGQMNIDIMQKVFGVQKNDGEKKRDFIDRIAEIKKCNN